MTTRRSLARRSLLRCAIGTALLAAAASSLAQAFPSKPVTLIVPWPPGGSTDRHLRGLAEIASKYLGQNIVVENKPGGGGTIGPSQMALYGQARRLHPRRSSRWACCASLTCRSRPGTR